MRREIDFFLDFLTPKARFLFELKLKFFHLRNDRNILREKAHSHGVGDRDDTGNLETCRAASGGGGDYDMVPG